MTVVTMIPNHVASRAGSAFVHDGIQTVKFVSLLQRSYATQPRVGRFDLPWVNVHERSSYPERVMPFSRHRMTQPRWGWSAVGSASQGSSQSLATLGYVTQLLWSRRTKSWNVRVGSVMKPPARSPVKIFPVARLFQRQRTLLKFTG